MDRAYSTNGAKRNLYSVMVGKPEGKKLLVGGRIILRWILEK
jgi:hypothetical protein